MQSWFISDIHLRNVNERNGNTLLRFLFYLNKNPKDHTLFLVGDIFDAWTSDGSAFIKQYKILIDELTKFKNSGGEVYYFEGNHDVHIDVFWEKKLKIKVFEDRHYFDLDGLKVRVEHGDFINPDDKAYLQYRELIHRAGVEFLAHNLPSIFWKWISELQSSKSRKRSSKYAAENSEKIRELIRTYAEKVYQNQAFDVIVTGHMHIFDDYEFTRDNKKIRSVNLGTWLDTPCALKIENKKIEIVNIRDLLEESSK